MGKPQYKSPEHVIAHYKSEVMDVIETHTEGIDGGVYEDMEADIGKLLADAIKDSERIAKQKEQED